MKRGALKKWANSLKKNTYALYLVSKDPRVPFLAKILIGLVMAYALSPIDLIPDFIPVIGLLDDLLLLPLGIWLAIRLIPQPVWKECQSMAEQQTANMPTNRYIATVIIIIWIFAIAAFIYWLWSLTM